MDSSAVLWRLGSLGLLAVSFATARNQTASSVYQGTDRHQQGVVMPLAPAGDALQGARPGTERMGRGSRSAGRDTGTATALPVAPCQTSYLRGSIGGESGAAGSVITTIVLRNISGQTCSIIGYPGLSLIDRAGRQIGRPATWTGGVPVRPIVLQPGASASTLARTLNPGVGTTRCLPPSAALRLYPPNQWTALVIPARLSECLGRFEVRPFVAGTSGS